MPRNCKYILVTLVMLLSACGDGDRNKPQYTVTLTDITLNKKGSGEPLPVSGLPAQGATVTRK